MPTIKPFGDSALLIEWEARIDAAINREVMALADLLNEQGPTGILDLIPAYCSLTVVFNPARLRYAQLLAWLQENQARAADQQSPGRHLRVPVCYADELAPDLPAVAQARGLTPAAFVEHHCRPVYRVFMLGFLPGFPYLGEVDPLIASPRRDSPRARVPAGSVGLAGRQTGIYPMEAPGGWQLIGRTPLPLFRPAAELPFLFQPGDLVTFQPIGREAYAALAQDIAAGRFEPDSLLFTSSMHE